jgi:hypothetical protein
MRGLVRIVVVAFAAALVGAGVQAPAHAAGLSVNVYGGTTAEFRKVCENVAPFACGTFTNVASFMIQTWGQTTSTVTVGYEFLPGTATAGVDYTGPFTGSVTIQYNFPQAWVSVPVVNDAIAEPSETIILRITSVSRPAKIGAPDDTIIFDGGNMPADCDPSRTFSSGSITCTGRPAGQQWRTNVQCDRGEYWPNDWTRIFTVYGNTVTGNGTSTGTCPDNLFHTGGPAYQPL